MGSVEIWTYDGETSEQLRVSKNSKDPSFQFFLSMIRFDSHNGSLHMVQPLLHTTTTS